MRIACFAGLLLALVATPATARELPAGASFESITELHAARKIWHHELTRAATRTKEVILPKSLAHRAGLRRRFLATEAAYKLRDPLFTVATKLAGELRQGKDKRQDLESFMLTRLREQLRVFYGDSRITHREVERTADKLQGLYHYFMRGASPKRIRLDHLDLMTRHYEAAARELARQYPDEINDRVISGAKFGAFGMQLLAASMDLRSETLDALLALSYLHPITDDALDRGRDVRASMAKISRHLAGERQRPANGYERVIFDLLGRIERAFPPADHPLLTPVLQELHRAQLDSARIQRDPKASLQQLLDVEMRKIGFSSIAFPYLAIGPLTKAETEFFYKMGLLVQLGDDLSDLPEDLRDGTETIWTRAQRQGDLDEAVAIYFNLQRHLERTAKKILGDSPHREALVANLKMAIKLYVQGAVISRQQDSYFRRKFAKLFPLSPANTRAVIFGMHRHLEEIKETSPEVQRMVSSFSDYLDRHFFNEEHAAFQASKAGGRKAKRIYRIRSLNPLMAAVKLAHGFRRLVTKASGRGETALVMALSFLVPHLYALNQIANQDAQAALGLAAVLSGGGMLSSDADRATRSARAYLVSLAATTWYAALQDLLPMLLSALP